MKPNLYTLRRIVDLVIVVTFSLSLVVPGNGLITAQAKSASRSSLVILPGVTEAAAPQENQSGVLQQEKTKVALERLRNLINASGVQGAVGYSSNLAKIDSHLQDLVSDHLSGADVIEAAQRNDIQIRDGQAVLLDIYVNGALDDVTSQLEGIGLQVLATNGPFGIVEGYLPIDSILQVASLQQTEALLPVMAYGVDTGSVTSQGDAAHHGPAARALGTNGAGVVVGVISDSMNKVGTKLAGSQASGDLPANVTILSEPLLCPDCVDEGRAMAEIIYDTAPGITTMYFASGTTGAAGKATAINNLVSHGVDIIADDTFYLNEPFFQDGQVAQAVNAAYNAGVAYLVSAGNRGRQSYESSFRHNGGRFHDFDPGTGIDEMQIVTTVPNGNSISIVLQWDDPWGSASHDFDTYLYDDSSFTLLTSAETDNVATGLPVETINWSNNTGSAVTVSLAIYRFVGTDNSFLKWIAHSTFNGWTVSAWNTNSNAINPDAASAPGAMTVAAVRWNESGLNDPEAYSSRGPAVIRVFNSSGNRISPDVRQRPQVAGADCVATSSNFSGGGGFGGGTFCGTSAAAPSVAGVAALVLGARPNLQPQQLYAVLTSPTNTNDCTLAGNPDADCGYGFVLADKAVAWARRVRVSDFNGDMKTDVALFRPSNGVWYVKDQFSVQYGAPGDIPVSRDYNGDGRSDVAVFRSSNGVWYVKDQFSVQWGTNGDIPAPGDYNGDGRSDLAVFRPSDGVWYVKDQFSIQWGTNGDIPVPGDYNRDGRSDVAVFRPSNGVWYVKDQFSTQFGANGDIPVPGDYDRDGDTDVAIFRPSNAVWYVKNQFGVQFGANGDIPVPGDHDGDGDTDVAVFRPSNGVWYVKDQFSTQFGANGDIPVPSLWTGEALTTGFYFRLTWGLDPSDLDSHLWLPVSYPYHVYYGDRGTLTTFPYANLDQDDMTGYGPETIAIQGVYPGTYVYAVHHFDGLGSLNTSGAQVVIYWNGSPIQTFNVPTSGSGIWWYVFDFNGSTGIITAKNYLTSTPPGAYGFNDPQVDLSPSK